jgi:hypothetical protein
MDMAGNKRIRLSNRSMAVTVLLVLFCFMGAGKDSWDLGNVEQMTDSQKRQLLEKKRLFYQLDVSEQQRLRDLHQQLQLAADRELLVEVMNRYSQWMRSLPNGQRVEVLSLPLEERVEAIKQIQQEQEERRLEVLSSTRLDLDDSRVISRWLDSLLAKHGEQLRESFPQVLAGMRPTQRAWLTRMPDSRQRDRVLAATLVTQVSRLDPPVTTTIPITSELGQLAGLLSSRGQQTYEAVESELERQQLLARWIFAVAFRSLRTVSEEELIRFYLEDLSAEDRDDVDHFSGDKFRQVLNAYYIRDKGLGTPFGRRPDPGLNPSETRPRVSPNRQP